MYFPFFLFLVRCYLYLPQCIVVHSKTVILTTYSVYIYQNYKWMLYYWDLNSHILKTTPTLSVI